MLDRPGCKKTEETCPLACSEIKEESYFLLLYICLHFLETSRNEVL